MYRVTLGESKFTAQRSEPFVAETLHQMLARQADCFGEKNALEEILPDGSTGRCWTYSALLADAERLGRALASRHQPGMRLAVFANNLPEWVLLEFATAFAGQVLVTVNPSLRADELRYVLQQSGAEAIYFAASVRGSDLRAVIDEALQSMQQQLPCIELSDHTTLFAGEQQGSLPETSPDDVVQIQYTSGTTGFPKGAQLRQQGLVANGHAIMRRVGVDSNGRLPGFMPLFHTSGCGISILGGLGCGATVLLMRDFDPAVAIGLLENHGANFLSGVPTMLVAIFDLAEQRGSDLSVVRGLMSGGAMVSPELNRRAQQLCRKPVLITYGQTEASPGITGTWPGDSDEDLCDTVGQPYPHMDVAIMQPGGSTVCPLQQQGEICVRGYNLMQGYNDNPDATAEAIDGDGWLHTGDLGRMDARGYVTITGRVKDMIIRGGENLFPAEIENAMLAHPAIAEVSVVGIPDEKWGELVGCFMRASWTEKPSDAELKGFIRERLSPQKTPSFWIWVDQWPLTGSGKIRKFVLRDDFVAGKYEQ